MDYVKKLSSALVILALATVLGACEDKETPLFIYAFDQKQIPEGLTDTVDVILGQTVQQEKLYVEVSNHTNPNVVSVTYNQQLNDKIVIKFKKGESKKTVGLKALKKGDAAIRFKIRDTSSFSTLSVKVVPVNYGDGQWDSGALPDRALMEAGPDTGSSDAKTTTPDKGAGDAKATDAKTTTPDKGTPDSAASGG